MKHPTLSSEDPDAEPTRSLTADTLSGLRWSYTAALASAIAQTGYVAAMSRLLTPRAFGLMAIATLVVNFGFYFSRMGIGQALIQRETIDDDDIRASVTAGLLLGGASALALLLTAGLVARVFDEPDAVPLLQAMSLSFVFSGLTMTGQALLRRELRFRELSLIQIGHSASGFAVGIALAIAGAGVWSLVGAALTTTIMHFLLQYWRVRHSLRPLWKFRQFGALYGFGARISLVRLGEFIGKNTDTFMVGTALATVSLGLYNRAFYLVNLPISMYLSSALSTVLFPSLSRIQQDKERLRAAYLSVVRLSAAVLFPICAGMGVASREIVLVALGEQWLEAVPLIPLFAVAAGLNIMSKLSELVCEARAQLNTVLILQFGYLGVLIGLLGVAAASDAGLWTFALALATGEVLRQTAYVALMRRVVGVQVSQLVRALSPALFAAFIVGGSISAVRLALVDFSPVAVVLAAEMATGAVALAVGIRFNPWKRLRRDFRNRIDDGVRLARDRRVAWLIGLVLGPAPAGSGEADETASEEIALRLGDRPIFLDDDL